MPRYRKTDADLREAEQLRRKIEKLRRDFREEMLREMKSAMQAWKKDLERELTQAMKSWGGNGSRSLSGASGEDGFSTLAKSLASFAFSMATRERSRTSVSAMQESDRSLDQNSFYRQSLSQRDASAHARLGNGQRNA